MSEIHTWKRPVKNAAFPLLGERERERERVRGSERKKEGWGVGETQGRLEEGLFFPPLLSV